MAQSYRRGPQRVQSGSSNNMDGTATGTAISKGQCVSFEWASMGAWSRSCIAGLRFGLCPLGGQNRAKAGLGCRSALALKADLNASSLHATQVPIAT
jgi:hypothetical protein